MAIERRRAMTRTVRVALGTIVLLAASASIALAADHAVSISGFSYSPRSATIAPGDTVTWTNSDAQAHTATADDASWNTGNLGNGVSGTVTFATAGTFPYHCAIHPDMTGTVTVQAAAGGGGSGATTPPTDTLPPEGAAGPGAGLIGLIAVLAGFVLGGTSLLRRGARPD